MGTVPSIVVLHTTTPVRVSATTPTNDVIEACVCGQDAYCCNTAWDATCAGEVESLGCGMC